MGTREGIMLCYPLEEKRLLKWGPPYIVQPKLDGDRCRAIIHSEDDIELVSSEGNPRNQSVPHIVEKLALLVKEGILNPPIELDGELYVHEGGYHELIHGIVSRTVNLHSDYRKAQYHIFDVINQFPQIIRTNEIERYETESPIVQVVRSVTMYDPYEIYEAIEEYIKQGYEGVIVRRPGALYERKRSTNMMKFKPRKSDSYVIADSIEEVSIEGIPKNSLGALVLMTEDGSEYFKVGSGSYLTQEMRSSLWMERDKLPGKVAVIKYQRMSQGRKVPVFPVLIDIIDRR